jgi:two-component system NtrC family sensor kinase
MYTQLLTKKLKSNTTNKDEVLEILSKMEMALTHSANLVRSLLDFARQSPLTLKPVAISKVIDQVMALVGHQAQLKKIKVVRDEALYLPEVKADFTQLQQVFINLVVNAIQAMNDGGILTIRTSQEGYHSVKVIIEDTGCGIPPENMDKLFTPFFSTKEAVKGVGLGLAVSYGIIERHGGRIEVKSQLNQGSTFSVCLPVYREGDSVIENTPQK